MMQLRRHFAKRRVSRLTAESHIHLNATHFEKKNTLYLHTAGSCPTISLTHSRTPTLVSWQLSWYNTVNSTRKACCLCCWKGYSFTTSVSIRLLPGLGDDILVFLFRSGVKILRRSDYFSCSAWKRPKSTRDCVDNVHKLAPGCTIAHTFSALGGCSAASLPSWVPSWRLSLPVTSILQRPDWRWEGLRYRITLHRKDPPLCCWWQRIKKK